MRGIPGVTQTAGCLRGQVLHRQAAGAGRAHHFLDGSAGGPSIDQHSAAAIGGDTLLPSLELGVESTDTFLETLVTHMCYGPVDQNDQYKRAIPIQPVDDPVQIYARLTGSTQAGTTEQILAALQNRKSVLDYVGAHEVAHLAELNHSPRFWAVVRRLCPEMEGPREWLRRNGASLHRHDFGTAA